MDTNDLISTKRIIKTKTWQPYWIFNWWGCQGMKNTI